MNILCERNRSAYHDHHRHAASQTRQYSPTTAQHGAHNVRVFGSVARGEAGPTSDVDLLVEMDRGRSLLDLIELSQKLEAFLQRKVDILTDGGLSPYLKQRIHAEAVPL
jgi:predicted nucleotidyltransferase